MGQGLKDQQPQQRGERVSAQDLQGLLARMLVRKGMYQADANLAVERMVEAELRGLSGWGCLSLRNILHAMDMGDIDPRASVLKMKETPAMAVLDAGKGLGPVGATRGMELAISKAREVGTATVIVKNGQDLGHPSLYALLAARQGLIGCCSTSGGPAEVAACGSSQAIMAHNGMAWAIPLSQRPPLVVDFSTASLHPGELRDHRFSRSELPGDSALDSEGNPLSHPAEARTLLPHENSSLGLSLICSILPGVLVGGKMPLHKSSPRERNGSEHLFSVYDPEAFGKRDDFEREIEEGLTALERRLPPQERPLFLPGEQAARLQEQRTRDGLALSPEILQELDELARALKVPTPWAQAEKE